MKDTGLLGAGYNYLNLDDCWGLRDAQTGHIQADPVRFPRGMKNFVDDVHALGFKVGVYTDMGVHGCHHPYTGSWPYYHQDARDFADWGIDYVKFDYCGPPAGYTPAGLTANFSMALESSGRPIWLNFHCNWLTFEDDRCAQLGNSFRIAPDHVDAWYSTIKTSKALINRKPWWGPGAYPDPDFVFTAGEGCGIHSSPGKRCPGQSKAEYRSEFYLNAMASGQILFASDPRNMSALQKDLWFNKEVLAVFRDTSGLDRVAMVSNYSLPLPQKGCNVTLTKQLSHGNCARGVNYGCSQSGDGKIWTFGGCRGLFTCYGTPNVNCESAGSSYPSRNNVTCSCAPEAPQVWIRPLQSKEQAAVLMFNAGDTSTDVTVSFSQVPGWHSSTKAHVRDIGSHADLGIFTKNYTSKNLLPHSSLFFKLTRREE